MDHREFLELSPGEVAEIVRAQGPNVCVFPINGTRRWFVLEYPEVAAEGITTSYLRISGRRHIELYRLFFDHGIETLLTPIFGPDILRRDESYRELLEEGLAWFATNDDFLAFYQEYDVRVRVYGDFARHLENTVYEHVLEAYRDLEARTASNRSRRLLYGVCAQDASESVAKIAIEFSKRRGRHPTREEIVEAYYGEYVDPVDLFIGFDRPAAFDMPLLALGSEALYFTIQPSLYVDAPTLKSILHDYLYARQVDDGNYSHLSTEDWEAMRQFYAANHSRVIGLGKKHPSSSFWYPTPQVNLPSSISRRLQRKTGDGDR